MEILGEGILGPRCSLSMDVADTRKDGCWKMKLWTAPVPTCFPRFGLALSKTGFCHLEDCFMERSQKCARDQKGRQLVGEARTSK